MFQGFLSFDILIVSKNMFLTCLCHVFLQVFISFSNLFSFGKHILYHVMFMALFLFQLHVTSFYNFIFYVSNILIFCYPSNFVRHGLYGFDKKLTMLLPCFKGFETYLLKKKIIFQGHVLNDFLNQYNKVADVTKLQTSPNVLGCSKVN